MALDISLSIDTISSDRLTATLLDGTTYGGANPARTAVGCYVIVQKMNSDSTVESTITATGNDADPQTDVSWEFNIPNDGWYRVLFIAPEDYSAGTTYALYDVAQDPATSIVYRSKQAGNIGNALSNTTYWEVVTALIALNEGEANESANLASTVFEFILTPNAEYNYANQISEASEEACSVNCSLENLFLYVRLGAILDGMVIDSDRGNYPEGERKARKFESLIESL
jgi:hypothetical protein